MRKTAKGMANGLKTFLVKPGQVVYRLNFVLSDFGKLFNAKLARKLIRAQVVRAVFNNAYEWKTCKEVMWGLPRRV